MNILDRFKSIWQSNRVQTLQKLVELQAIELKDLRREIDEITAEARAESVRLARGYADAEDALAHSLNVCNIGIKAMHEAAEKIVAIGKSFGPKP